MRNTIQETIYFKEFDYNECIRFSDLPMNIKDSDIIQINNIESYNARTELIIIREREENDEEYERRMEKARAFELELKNQRYQTYLKLKEEFEPIIKIKDNE